MTYRDDRPGDDPELRALLDSLGVTEDGPEVTWTNRGDNERAEATLARILDQPRYAPAVPTRRRAGRRRRGSYLVVAALVVAVLAVVWVVFTPGTTRRQTALAQTPAMLQFGAVRSGTFPSSGAPAAAELELLATRIAAAGSPPTALPVQHLEIDAWYSSTEPATPGARPRTVLIPTHRDSYLYPNGRLRAVERRGTPLDADGRVSRLPGGWNRQPLVSDELINTGGDRPADYPHTLPLAPGRLGRILAPPADCATTRGGCLLSAVSDLHSNFVLGPDLQRALWRLLAAEPSITYLGMTTDRVNRRAAAFTAASLTPGQQLVVLADPATGAYLGAETILVRPSPDLGLTPPAVIEFSSLLAAERIASADVPR